MIGSSGRYRRAELTGGAPLSTPELEHLERLKRRGLCCSLRSELLELEQLQRRAELARAAGAGQASGPEELGP